MRLRNATLAAAALGLVFTGCGDDSCKSESLDVIESTLPTSCSAQPGDVVTVAFEVCVRCNQATPTCTIDRSQTGFIEIDPLGEACDSGSSCPIPSCGFPGGTDLRTVTCAFAAPMTDVQLVVHDAGSSGVVQDRFIDLNVGAGSTTCL